MTQKTNYSQDDIEMYCPKNRIEWRQWLESNHITAQSVWLVYFKKNSGSFTLSWSEAVDEALCFGWIDSTAKSIDDKQYKQFFTKRKANSIWSKINKEKIKRLDEEGLIAFLNQRYCRYLPTLSRILAHNASKYQHDGLLIQKKVLHFLVNTGIN